MDALIVLLVNSLTPRVLEYLKRANWFPLMQAGMPWMNRAVALVVAGVSALGITATYDAQVGLLSVHGLLPDQLIRTALTLIVGLVVQETSYRLTVKTT